MTRTQAHVAFLIFQKLIAYIRKNGGNRDTYILNSLCETFEKFCKLYQIESKEI